jgi:hypothetical protein
MFDYETTHRWLLISHIVAGAIGLPVFWIPVFAKKGGRLHIRAGQVFVWCAYWVTLTGLVFSVWGLTHPTSLLGSSRPIKPESLPYVIEKLRFFYSILGFLSLAVLAGIILGVRVIRTRHDHEKLRGPLVIGVESALGLWSLGLAADGLWTVLACYGGWHPLLTSPGQGQRYWINVFLGLLGIYGVWGDLRFVLRPRESPMAWWYMHMECMLGAGIGFHTAFMVFGANRLLKLELEGVWNLLPWVLPSAIGIPATAKWVGYYRRKFESV